MGHHRAETRAARSRRTATPVTRESHPGPSTGARSMGSHRAESPVRAERTRGGGRSSGGKRSAGRKSLFPGLPSAPIVLGVAALAVSAGGAVSAAGPQLVGSDRTPTANVVVAAGALSGSSGVASVGPASRRGAVVSRDLRRDAQADAAGDDLAAVAEAQAQERQGALAAFAKKAERQAAKLELNQWQLPVHSYHLTARFGEYGLWSSYHTGLDFAAPTGTPIYAVANGVISSASYDGSYGNKTVQTLEDGTELWYCHQNSFVVSAGDEVHAGELIGYIGSTGHVTGPHLHLEVRPGGGDPVDPYQALVVNGVTP